jgi:5-methylcytosine-specific restriction endonuclease McrA
MNAAEKRLVLELCGIADVVAAASPSAHAVALIRQCDALKARIIRKQRAIQHVPKAELRSTKKAEKRKAHREETSAIRAAVMKRADGRCEVCGASEAPYNPLHMHHTVMGSGKRRQQQNVSNCVALCMGCHRKAHGEKR